MMILYYEMKKILKNKLFITLISIIISILLISVISVPKNFNVDYATNYQEEISNLIENSIAILNSSFFTNDTYTIKSNLLSTQLYNKLKTLNLCQTPIQTYNLLINGTIAVFMVIISILSSYLLFIKEKKDEKFIFTNPTLHGGIKNIITRQFSVFLISITSELILLVTLFGSSVLVKGSIIFKQLFLPIQQIESFLLCPFSISIGEFLIIIFVLHILLAYFLSIIFSILSIIINKLPSFLLLILLFLSSTFILNILINSNSMFNYFKYLNIWSLILPSNIFSKFHTMNILGYPILTIFTCIIFFVTLIIISQLLFIFFMSRKSIKIISYSKLLNKRPKYYSFVLNNFLFELKKLLFVEKGLVVLLFFIILVLYSYTNYSANLTTNEYYYKYYSEKLNGTVPLTSKDDFLKEEKLKFKRIEDEINNINDKFYNNEIDFLTYDLHLSQYNKELIGKEGFLLAENQYNTLVQEGQKIYIYQLGFKELFTINKINFILIIVFFIITISELYYIENKNNMNKLLISSYLGLNKVNKTKQIISYILILFMYTMATVIDFLIKCLNYDIIGFMYPSSSLLFLDNYILNNIPIIYLYIIKNIFILFSSFISFINKYITKKLT